MTNLDLHQTLDFLEKAIQARLGLFDAEHRTAFRLFNGFYEGCPELAVDLYAATLLIHDYQALPQTAQLWLQPIQDFLLSRLPWVKTVIVKRRSADDPQERRGLVTFGGPPDQKILENGVWYAIDLQFNRDASFYLDTRSLRNWIRAAMKQNTLLNIFAYTGSLGVAALAGGARRVIQLDRSKTALSLAAASYDLNNFSEAKKDLLVGDFFKESGRLRRRGQAFDCVLVDPPFFSASRTGRVDLVSQNRRLVNKIRPLVNHQGRLVLVNNAIFVPGRSYLAELESLCADGYMKIEELIPVSQDFTGYPETIQAHPPADPAPFNHTTKIVVLRVRRKNFVA